MRVSLLLFFRPFAGEGLAHEVSLPTSLMARSPRRAGKGMDSGATDTYRTVPPPPLPPFAEVLGAASTQPTTLPSSRYTSTRFPNPQGRLPEGLRPKDDPR